MATAAVEDTRKIDIGIDDKNRKAVIDLLQSVLANLSVIYSKTRNFHWNITGRPDGRQRSLTA